jgi:hypothetical protein
VRSKQADAKPRSHSDFVEGVAESAVGLQLKPAGHLHLVDSVQTADLRRSFGRGAARRSE